MSHPVQRLYRLQAPIYNWTRWMFLFGRRRAAEAMELAPDSRVLEIGCGTGLNFRFLLPDLDPDRGRLVGLDFSVDMLRKADRLRNRKAWKNVDLVGSDATRMGFAESFDAVFFAYSLTMIPDWPRALEGARALLRPGGRLTVLDFGPFRGWGPFGRIVRGWLRFHHVETLNPYLDKLRELFPDLTVRHWMGGYNFTATGTRE